MKSIYYNNYFAKHISFRDIPYEYWTDDIVYLALSREPYAYYDALLGYTIAGETNLSIDECLKLIPKKYYTINICRRLLNYDYIKYNRYVPREFIDIIGIPVGKEKEVFTNFKYIPEINRTPNLYRKLSRYSFDDYLMYIVNYHDIPDIYRIKKNCLAMFYANIDKYVREIPDEYKSIELCEMLVKRDFNKYFKIVPEDCRSVSMYEKLVTIDPYKYINVVPEGKRSQKMYDMYFECVLDYGFDHIPSEFRTKKMFIRLIGLNNGLRDYYIKKIPESCYDIDLIKYICKLDIKYLKMIPNSVKNEDLYLELIKMDINKFLAIIPKDLYSDQFFDKIIDIILEIKNNKKISAYAPIVDKLVLKNPKILSRFSDKVIKQFIEKEIYSVINNNGDYEAIKEKYGLNDVIIKNVLKLISLNDKKLNDRLKKNDDERKKAFYEKLDNNIIILEDIISSLGYITRKMLTTELKLKIAYLINNYMDCSLEELYKYNRSNNKYFSNMVNYFIEEVLNYNDNAIRYNVLNIKYGIIYNNPWLKEFNLDAFFDIRNGVAHSVYKYGNGEKELTVELANEIIQKLVLENIPTNYLIVTLAFRNYFNNSLTEYINNLHSYDIIDLKVKSRKRVSDNCERENIKDS